MVAEQERQELLRRYVLGDLLEQESEFVEEQYCTDDQWLMDLLAVRDDLLDDWTRGALTNAEQEKLARQCERLPALREHAAFAAQWQAVASVAPSNLVVNSRARWFHWEWFSLQWTAAIASVLLVLLGGWYWTVVRKKEPSSTEAQSPAPAVALHSDTPAPAPSATTPPQLNLKNKPASHESGKVLGLVLPPLTRDADDATGNLTPITLQREIRAVRLQFEVTSAEISSLYLNLYDAARKPVWQSTRLTVKTDKGARYIECEVPASVLPAGSYRVELRDVAQQLVSLSGFQVIQS